MFFSAFFSKSKSYKNVLDRADPEIRNKEGTHKQVEDGDNLVGGGQPGSRVQRACTLERPGFVRLPADNKETDGPGHLQKNAFEEQIPLVLEFLRRPAADLGQLQDL